VGSAGCHVGERDEEVGCRACTVDCQGAEATAADLCPASPGGEELCLPMEITRECCLICLERCMRGLNGRHCLTFDGMMSFTDSLTYSPNSSLSRASPCRSSSLWMQDQGSLLFKPPGPLDRQLPPAQQQISKWQMPFHQHSLTHKAKQPRKFQRALQGPAQVP